MKRIVVHLGLRKTATTAIQYLLDAHADMLGANIKAMAWHRRFEAWRNHVYRFMTAPEDDAAKYRREMIEGITEEAKKLAKWFSSLPEETIIISDENLFASRVYAHNETIFDWAHAVLPIVVEAWQDFDLRFVLYIRDEKSWLASCHNQEVKNNRLAKSYLDWSVEIPEYFDLRKNAADLADRSEVPFKIVDMDEEMVSDRVIGTAVLSEAGLTEAEIAALPPVPRLNQSLPASAVDFMIALNRLDIPDASKPAIGQLVSRLRHLFA